MKLGELLVRKGIIDWPQLEEALSDQLVHGGHLGTCLIERKFIDEATLGQALAETSGMPYAPPRVFQDIPRNVIGTIPYKLVVKHSVIPFRLSKQTLDVAMINPKDLTATDELSFAAGCGITPWISPEATILQALERYYDIPQAPPVRDAERAPGPARTHEPGPAVPGHRAPWRRVERRDHVRRGGQRGRAAAAGVVQSRVRERWGGNARGRCDSDVPLREL